MRRTRVTLTFDELAAALCLTSPFARDCDLTGQDVMAVQVDHSTRTIGVQVSIGQQVPDGQEARGAGSVSPPARLDPTRPAGAPVTS